MESSVSTESLADRDRNRSYDVADLEQLMQECVEASDRSVKQMMDEVQQVGNGPGKLTNVDYARYRLYEADKDERASFISDKLHWPIENLACDQELAAVCSNKWRCTVELESAGITTVPIAAMIDTEDADRSYGETTTLRTAEDLAAFLSAATLPLFAKPNEALGSYGATRIESFDGTELSLAGVGQATPETVLHELMTGDAYVLQQVVENHSWIRGLSRSLATVRVANLVDKNGGSRIPYAAFKIPGGDNIADNFWRSGNLVADVDVETGEIGRVVSNVGPRQIVHQTHPDTGQQLAGEHLPFWSELIELTERCAAHFTALRYHTLDIAITDDGPVVVEVNSGGSFDLPQIASGQGLLTKKNKKFFESCGVNFRRIKVA